MDKKLIDYIQYCVGQKCFVKDIGYGRIHSADRFGDVMVKMDLTIKTIHVNVETIKPILRRLEDITDDEWLEIENETSIIPDAIGWHGIKESFMTMDIRHRWHWTITNEALMILRKREVDVDQLIKNGLAIDSNTLK